MRKKGVRKVGIDENLSGTVVIDIFVLSHFLINILQILLRKAKDRRFEKE